MAVIKFTQLVGGFVLLLAGILFVLVTLFSPIFPGLGKINQDLAFWVWIAIPLFLLAYIQFALSWISRSFLIEEEKLADLRKKNIFSQLAGYLGLFYKYADFLKAVIFSAVFLSLIAWFIYGFGRAAVLGAAVLTGPFFIQLGTYLAYFIFLKKVISRAFLRIEKFFRKQLAVYTIELDGVIINLPIRKLGSQKQFTVKLPFSEISDIKELSFVEAQSFLRYQIGPDVTLQAQAVKDLYQYLAGKIERPNKYVLLGSAGKTLLVQGPEIFYLITVQNTDCSDLLNAFRAFKSK